MDQLLRPTRRRVLGLGLGVVTLAVAPIPAARPARAAEDHDYECMADLVESGEVTRADLMAG